MLYAYRGSVHDTKDDKILFSYDDYSVYEMAHEPVFYETNSPAEWEARPRFSRILTIEAVFNCAVQGGLIQRKIIPQGLHELFCKHQLSFKTSYHVVSQEDE